MGYVEEGFKKIGFVGIWFDFLRREFGFWVVRDLLGGFFCVLVRGVLG